MSIGLCGFCRKFIEDSEFVIYEYYSRDMNNKNFLNDDKNFDGFITIRKNFLLSPESDEKSTNSKKNKSRKNSLRADDAIQIVEIVYDLIDNGKIETENCSNACKILENGIDTVCYKLCVQIFIEFKKNGILPERCFWMI